MMVKKLTVGVIGLGMGAAHLQGVIDYGAEVGLICDVDPEKLKTVGEKHQIPAEKQTTDWQDIVKNKEINAVIIATPDQQHRAQIEACLAAGKHIMCEKPLALTREDLNAIVKAVEAHPACKFMVGQICRFTPAFVKAKELIDAGRIGDIYFAESEYAHDYAPLFKAGRMGWRVDPDRNGVVGGGCHAVDLLRWLIGSDPFEVFAYGTHKLLPQVTYDDANLAVMKFPGEVMGKVFVSTACKRNYTMRTCVYGTKGTLIFDNTGDRMEAFFCDENGEGGHHPEIIPIDVNNHNATAEFKEFADCLVEDRPIATTVYEGAKTVAVCHAIVTSANEGRVVDPDYDFQ